MSGFIDVFTDLYDAVDNVRGFCPLSNKFIHIEDGGHPFGSVSNLRIMRDNDAIPSAGSKLFYHGRI